ncbi:type VII secretion-associated serine protease mycosin [Nocardia nova]|uniref:type VII secretion-associated serine protease mycosin n=1 Tax=Nocardia nova TaxID=37330 RepID=UPI000CEA3CA8|nr:type VII secretion-associated serine protease mycosin [Nocardia nova]PPI95691.1 type VII secretion-associated serine protease mycosin [Nocardia nova]
MTVLRYGRDCPVAGFARGAARRLRVAAAAAVLGASLLGGGPAPAVAPPAIDEGALGQALAVNAKNGPPDQTEKRAVCAEPYLTGAIPRDPPLPQRILDLDRAWKFSRGAGQKVAVIDTGVNRHPRLPDLQPGGDFVTAGDGTEDCDGHGTLVAGLIAARPSPADAFSGVAPEAQILAIRQLSLQYEAKNRNNDETGKVAAGGYGDVLTMAAAVVRAVDMGATVINISEVSCSPAGSETADGALGAAVEYAADRNVVVVAAAGNLDQSACSAQNDTSGWNGVRTVISPAWFTPYVLSVASTDPDGATSPFSIHGPWVGVAAPGRSIISLDSKPGGTGLVDTEHGDDGPLTIDGTSFSAAFVSGLAALVRSRFPELSAAQVIDRIERTAHNPGAGRDDRVGFGLIDPLAALTAQLPPPPGQAAQVPQAIAPPAPDPGPDPLPRRVATVGSGALLALLAVGWAAALPYRRRRSEPVADDPAAGYLSATPAPTGTDSPRGE